MDALTSNRSMIHTTMKPTITTSAGRIAFMDFTKFLTLVPKRYVGDRPDVDLMIQTGFPIVSFEDGGLLMEGSSFTRLKGILYKRPNQAARLELLKEQVAAQLPIKIVQNNSSLPQTIEELAVTSMMEMGYPSAMVRFSKRVWLIVNPNDFCLFENTECDQYLACYAPNKSILAWIPNQK